MFLRWTSDVSEKKKVSKSFRKERKKSKNRTLYLIFIYLFFSLSIKLSEMSKLVAILLVILSLRAHHLPLGQ